MRKSYCTLSRFSLAHKLCLMMMQMYTNNWEQQRMLHVCSFFIFHLYWLHCDLVDIYSGFSCDIWGDGREFFASCSNSPLDSSVVLSSRKWKIIEVYHWRLLSCHHDNLKIHEKKMKNWSSRNSRKFLIRA